MNESWSCKLRYMLLCKLSFYEYIDGESVLQMSEAISHREFRLFKNSMYFCIENKRAELNKKGEERVVLQNCCGDNIMGTLLQCSFVILSREV